MTYEPENNNPPVFDLERFKRDHISTVEFVDSVATELGFELPETAPRPALIKTHQPVEQDAAEIKRELWENPTITERVDIAPAAPVKEEKEAGDIPDLQPFEQQEPEKTETPIEAPDLKPTKEVKTKQKKTKIMPPVHIKSTLQSVPSKPDNMEIKDDYLKDDSKEIGWFRVFASVVILISFIATDCYAALYSVPTYMLVVRLACFAIGFIFAGITAWRAAGVKLAISLAVIALFLFHFNNNKPVLSLVEMYHGHTHAEETGH